MYNGTLPKETLLVTSWNSNQNICFCHNYILTHILTCQFSSVTRNSWKAIILSLLSPDTSRITFGWWCLQLSLRGWAEVLSPVANRCPVSACNTFSLMCAYPLITGRDYFIFSTWEGERVSDARNQSKRLFCFCFFLFSWHFGHELDSTEASTHRRPGHAPACFSMCRMNFPGALCKSRVMRSKQSEWYSPSPCTFTCTTVFR